MYIMSNKELYRDDDICSICLEGNTYENFLDKLECGHRFHPKCIEEWLDSGNDYFISPPCPNCRQPTKYGYIDDIQYMYQYGFDGPTFMNVSHVGQPEVLSKDGKVLRHRYQRDVPVSEYMIPEDRRKIKAKRGCCKRVMSYINDMLFPSSPFIRNEGGYNKTRSKHRRNRKRHKTKNKRHKKRRKTRRKRNKKRRKTNHKRNRKRRKTKRK